MHGQRVYDARSHSLVWGSCELGRQKRAHLPWLVAKAKDIKCPYLVQGILHFYARPKIARPRPTTAKKNRSIYGIDMAWSTNRAKNSHRTEPEKPLYIISFELLSHGNELIFQYFRYLAISVPNSASAPPLLRRLFFRKSCALSACSNRFGSALGYRSMS